MGTIKDSLKECVEGYVELGETDIHALAPIDAEIITVFFEIIQKFGLDIGLEQLLDLYKQMPDIDFLAMIKAYAESVQQINRRAYINIKNQFVGNIADINSFTRGSYYDTKNHRVVPVLIINKSENNKVPYANTNISFASEDELENEFIKIKEKLSKHSNIIFI